AAEGSLRDALSLLDTAIAYGNGRLEADTTASLLGTTAPAEVRAFAAALLAHETAPALEAIDRAARDGEDLAAFTRDVIELLRRALVLTAAPTAGMQASLLGDAPRPAATRPAVTEAPRPTFEARPAGGRESMPPRVPAVPVERSAAAERPAPAVTPPEPSSELGVAWQRVVDEINKKKPMLGGMLAQVVPGG